uniref:Secreted protein n=1 Tax=Trichuris muris TaxID=70415 RepID=A0A5S6QDD9_TRIMR
MITKCCYCLASSVYLHLTILYVTVLLQCCALVAARFGCAIGLLDGFRLSSSSRFNFAKSPFATPCPPGWKERDRLAKQAEIF